MGNSLVDWLLEGFNAVVLALGPVDSGKSFALFGERNCRSTRVSSSPMLPSSKTALDPGGCPAARHTNSFGEQISWGPNEDDDDDADLENDHAKTTKSNPASEGNKKQRKTLHASQQHSHQSASGPSVPVVSDPAVVEMLLSEIFKQKKPDSVVGISWWETRGPDVWNFSGEKVLEMDWTAQNNLTQTTHPLLTPDIHSALSSPDLMRGDNWFDAGGDGGEGGAGGGSGAGELHAGELQAASDVLPDSSVSAYDAGSRSTTLGGLKFGGDSNSSALFPPIATTSGPGGLYLEEEEGALPGGGGCSGRKFASQVHLRQDVKYLFEESASTVQHRETVGGGAQGQEQGQTGSRKQASVLLSGRKPSTSASGGKRAGDSNGQSSAHGHHNSHHHHHPHRGPSGSSSFGRSSKQLRVPSSVGGVGGGGGGSIFRRKRDEPDFDTASAISSCMGDNETATGAVGASGQEEPSSKQRNIANMLHFETFRLNSMDEARQVLDYMATQKQQEPQRSSEVASGRNNTGG